MAVNIAINGFGRIGRCVTRLASMRDDIRVVAVNARAEAAMSAHLLKYDSTHGVLAAEVIAESDALIVNGQRIAYYREADPSALPWRESGIAVAMECTGRFNDAKKAAAHITAGARRVLVSAPAKNSDLTIVYGVNHTALTHEMRIISNASCTTNCLAPVAKVLHETFGIEAGLLNTVHAYTNDQRILDGSHADYRRARSAAVSMVPTKTGAASAIGEVLPALAGKLSGLAVRVPTANVSLVDLTCLLSTSVIKDQVNEAFRTAATGDLAGVLAVSDLPLVSVDFNQRPESAIVDALQTTVSDGRLVKVLAWYDNEWGFSCRMIDTAIAMAAQVAA